jgi:ubiquinone/menaquinone biosynthesis C-methylase UbiE
MLRLAPNRLPSGRETGSVVDIDAFAAFEAAGWEARAAEYDHYWPGLTGRLSDPLLDAVGAGAHTRVLDVACGPGHLAGRAVARGASATGVDIAEAMVVLARQRHPGADFQQADAQSLPFPDGSFDAVVGNLAIPHLGSPEQAVAEFRRVLTGAGRLALSTWDRPDRARLVGVLLEAVREAGAAPPETVPAGPDFFRFADDAEFTALLTGQGFVDVEVRSVAFTHPVSSADELWEGLLRGTVRTAAVIHGQPEDVVQRIRAGFDRKLADYRSGQAYHLPVAYKLAVGGRSG